jgi:hypothetical protein
MAIQKREPPQRTTPVTPNRKPRPTVREARRTKRAYRALDLRPSFSTGGKRKGDKRKRGKRDIPWAGNSRFARSMRKYHNRWMEDMRDRRGLVDTYFGKVTIVLDRCIEIWVQRNLAKHMKTAELIGWFKWSGGIPTRTPQWFGYYIVTWSPSGKVRVRLKKSRGLHRLNPLFLATTKRCMKRLPLPKRLKGKAIWMSIRTAALAFYRIEPKHLIGFTEVRNPQTGGVEFKFTHWGSISVSSNTVILRQRIKQ